MIFVFSIFYYNKKVYEINTHLFKSFEKACEIAGEMANMETKNTYIVVDDREV